MNEELSVSLGLDTSKYETSLEGALKVFDGFQKTISSKKLGFNDRQIVDLNNVFAKVRNTAISEINRIQNRMDKLSKEKFKIDIDTKSLTDKLELLKYDLSITWNADEAKKIREQISVLEKQLETNEIKLNVNSDAVKTANEELRKLYVDIQNNPLEFEFDSGKLLQFNNQIQNIIDGYDKAGNKVDEFDDKVTKSSSKLNLMGRMFSQIKNTIASAINPLNNFRRAWNNIIMTDTSKFGNTFKLIGENINKALTPIIEALAQRIINLIGYLNVFLKTLSGGKIDLFAKSAKSAASTAKSVKEANKNLAGFDELTNIGDSGSGGKDTKDPGIVQPDLNPKWVKTIEDWGKKIKDVWNTLTGFFKTVSDKIGVFGTIALVVGGVIAVFLLLKKVFGGVGSSLSGLGLVLVGVAAVLFSFSELLKTMNETGTSSWEVLGLLAGIFTIVAVAVTALSKAVKGLDLKAIAGLVVIFAGVVAIIMSVNEVLKTLSTTTKGAGDIFGSLFGVLVLVAGIIAALTIAAMILGSNPLALVAVVTLAASLSAILLVVAATLPTILDAIGKFITTIAPPLIKLITTIFNGIKQVINALGVSLPPIVNSIGKLFNTIFNGISKVVTSVGNVIVKILNSVKSLVTTVLKSLLDFINKLGPAANNLIDNLLKGVTKLINFMVSALEFLINSTVIAAIKGMVKAINLIPGVDIDVPKDVKFKRFVPQYDVGANYIPNDQLAVVHKGEAIIPAKFNDKKFFGNNDNEETNELLRQVITAVENIEINPYTTVKDVGSASLNYIKNKSRDLGRSVL